MWVSFSSAWDRRTGTLVAIKKLHRPFQSKLFAKRAYRELRLLKHMKHENVRLLPTDQRWHVTLLAIMKLMDSFLLCRWLDCWMFSLLKSHWTACVTCQFPPITKCWLTGVPLGVTWLLFSRCHSYLVMPFMGTDLGKLMKLERLTENRVQFLVYQMLKGLKVLTYSSLTVYIKSTVKCC